MVNRQRIEEQTQDLHQAEFTVREGSLLAWLGTELRTRHEDALRGRSAYQPLRNVNPMPA